MNTITDLQNLIQDLLSRRSEIQELTDKLDILKVSRDTLQGNLLESMKANNLVAWKTIENTFSITTKTDTKIIDEEKLIYDIESRWLTGLIFPKIDSIRFKQIANALLKQTWEVFDGTECVTSEYISIRKTV